MVFALVFSRRPILAHTLGDWDCACGNWHIKTTRHVIWNPLRNRAPEVAAHEFLANLRANRCFVRRELCEDALARHRVSDWRLAYREDDGDTVSLYLELTKYGGGPEYNPTGAGVIEVQRGVTGWVVNGFDCYF
jgi:hypothetical protein